MLVSTLPSNVVIFCVLVFTLDCKVDIDEVCCPTVVDIELTFPSIVLISSLISLISCVLVDIFPSFTVTLLFKEFISVVCVPTVFCNVLIFPSFTVTLPDTVSILFCNVVSAFLRFVISVVLVLTSSSMFDIALFCVVCSFLISLISVSIPCTEVSSVLIFPSFTVTFPEIVEIVLSCSVFFVCIALITVSCCMFLFSTFVTLSVN